jgi:hypothetical protein
MNSNGETLDMKVLDPEKLWNFVVYNFFIWNHIVNEFKFECLKFEIQFL